MSLLREIQEAAVSETTSVATVLRKCRILAARLKHDDLKTWVLYELDGYPDFDSIPSYRILSCESFGNFFGRFGSEIRNAQIPLSCLPEKWRESLSNVYFNQGVGELQDLVSSSKEGKLQQLWSADLYPIIGQQIYQDMNLVQAWKKISQSGVVGILDAVRNKILNFSLEIEAENPEAGESAPGAEPPVAPGIMNQIFNNNIYGNVGNIASASPHARQHSNIAVKNNDFESLAAFLSSSVGVTPDDISGLKEAVKQDEQPKEGHFGARVAGWIGGMVTKAAQGTLKVGVNVASSVITQALKGYYGLP